MAYSLIIIDMQVGFPASHNEHTLAAVIREIKQAQRIDRPIFLVEVSQDIWPTVGPTHPDILEALRGYDKWWTVEKSGTDGSFALTTPEVECVGDGPAIHDHTKCNRLRMVGINTDCCVQATACSLKHLGFDVEVVADACHSQYNHLWGLEAMRREGCRMLHLDRM